MFSVLSVYFKMFLRRFVICVNLADFQVHVCQPHCMFMCVFYLVGVIKKLIKILVLMLQFKTKKSVSVH